jgi:Methyltransferase FkbM domain
LLSGPHLRFIDQGVCEFHQCALWDRNERIGFRVDRDNPANSRIVGAEELLPSDETFEAITVDSFAERAMHPIDLIKLDVEGGEMNVLRGAARSIKRDRPQLAVSLYHRRDDLLGIPEFCLSLNPEYTFTVSAHNATFVDIVLYASP